MNKYLVSNLQAGTNKQKLFTDTLAPLIVHQHGQFADLQQKGSGPWGRGSAHGVWRPCTWPTESHRVEQYYDHLKFGPFAAVAVQQLTLLVDNQELFIILAII